MVKKLSEYEVIEGFNKTASALFKENNLSITNIDDFYRLFPDQKEEITIETFLKTLPEITNTDKFIEKIKNYNKNYPICIAGDYDVDGISATVIMSYGLQQLGYQTTFVIPNRLTDGYGNQENLVADNIKKHNTKLLITVDNGITSKNLIEMTNSQGVDSIITDHHLPDNLKIPNTLIIDPKFNNDEFSDICGAYVAFKLIYALYKEVAPEKIESIIYTLLPFAGIATIADMMPILCENRNLIKLTLQYINSIKYQQSNPLYKIIYSLGGDNFLKNQEEIATEELISFSIAPAINAISRVHGSVTFLTQKILDILNNPLLYFPSFKQYNYSRQQLTSDLLKDFDEKNLNENSIVSIYDEDNYSQSIKGVLGLIANKIAAKYNKVSLIGSQKSEDITEFSGRSIPTYNLHEGIKRINLQHPEFEIAGGGHAQAMGIRLLTEQLENFKTALENDIKENSVPYEKTIFEYEDEIMPEVISTMEELQPFGTDFKKLVFSFRGIFESYDKITKIAVISGKEFRMFISEANADSLLNTEIKVNFVISFSSAYGPIYSIVKE